MKPHFAAIAVAAMLVAPATASAQQAHGHAGHTPAAKTGNVASSASTKAFEDANTKMHKDMAIEFSGNADIDFVRGMIPHHQGAIDMAEVVLRHGKDARIRKLAREIIKAQKAEIAMMRAWLAKNDRAHKH